MQWVLIIYMWHGALSIPMKNEAACMKAAPAYDVQREAYSAFCLNTDTGDVRK